MRESKIVKAGLRRLAETILDYLPSTSNPFALPLDEAISIGKKIYPYWILSAVRCPGSIIQVEAICEMLGRGFMFAAPRAIPRWMEEIWALKESVTDRAELIDAVCDIIIHVEDAEKLVQNWHLFACGWTEDEVILEYVSRVGRESAAFDPHEQALEDLENL